MHNPELCKFWNLYIWIIQTVWKLISKSADTVVKLYQIQKVQILKPYLFLSYYPCGVNYLP